MSFSTLRLLTKLKYAIGTYRNIRVIAQGAWGVGVSYLSSQISTRMYNEHQAQRLAMPRNADGAVEL